MVTLSDILHIPGAKGCDIDDVVIPLKDHIIPTVNSMFGYRIHRYFGERDYAWIGLENIKMLADVGITREDTSTMLKYMEKSGVMENIMPYIYCIASLNSLSESEKLFFVTSRGNGFYEDPVGMTNRWQENVKAQNKFFKPLEVIYNHNKEEALIERDIKMLFEDNPVFALRVLEKDVPVVLFNNSWNRLTSHDEMVLTPKAYAEKVATIRKLDTYNNKLLFRVNNWHEVFISLVYKK